MADELKMPVLEKSEPLPEEPLFESFFMGDFSDGQEAIKASTGKYKQFLPVTENEVTKEVHEYVCPDGSAGWQAFVRETVDGKEMVKSFGVGSESEDRSHDWAEVVTDEI